MANTTTQETKQETKAVNSYGLRKLTLPLPSSWKRAAGLLRHKKKALENHLKKVRAEWDRRSFR